MSLRPASVDPQGGPITGNGGGPMSLAKPAASWSHATGKRHPMTESVEIPTNHLHLAEAMRSLPGQQARALLLHDGLGMTIAETARDLGVPEGTVTSWLTRSRKVVATKLQQPDPFIGGE